MYVSRAAVAGALGQEPECQVTDVASGQDVATSASRAVDLTLGDEEFRSLASFRVDRDGRYRVRCSNPGGEPVRMAVGPRIRVLRSVARVFAAIGVGLVSLGLTAAVVAVTAVKRNQHRRRLDPSATPT